MQLAVGLALSCGLALVQATMFAGVSAMPSPDLVLLLVLSWSLLRGVTEGTVVAIVGGAMLDLLSAAPFGLHLSLLGGLGFATALGEENLFRGSLPLFVLAAALATVILHGASLLLLQLAGLQTVGFVQFVQTVVPRALLNVLVMPAMFVAVQRLVRMLGGWRQLEL